jgi:hypothetical protein
VEAPCKLLRSLKEFRKDAQFNGLALLFGVFFTVNPHPAKYVINETTFLEEEVSKYKTFSLFMCQPAV